MCGIVGYAGFAEPGLVQRMCDAIVHRGPDGEGQAEFHNEAMAIGMRRLAIIDIAGGDQPMVSADGRVSLVFNGEIYNYESLRSELVEKGHRFHTRSDTEVVLEAYLEWGAEAWVRLRGMFALAIVDRQGPKPKLIIVRDHVGIKPLYLIVTEGRLLFASEIKALLAWDQFSVEPDLQAVRDYLALRYVPGPGSMFKGVRRLPAGHFLTFCEGDVSIERWWKPPIGLANGSGMTAEEASASFGQALRQAVARHMISDVPVGAFLSGGVDSNAIVALMAEHTAKPVKTFTIGFPDFLNGDSQRARLTAQALKSDHHQIECRASDLSSLPEIAWALDEPVGDAIIVPLYVLSREARRSTTVVLSGEGADEILGGYMFHRKLLNMERLRRVVPRFAWPIAAALVERLPSAILDRMFDYPGTLGEEGRRKVARMVAALGTTTLEDLYRTSISLFDADDLRAAAGSDWLQPRASGFDETPSTLDHLDRLIIAQFRDWLPDLILGKYDKLTMAHSLEGRVPFMDPDVIAAAAHIPTSRKLAPNENKKPLRDFAQSILPPQVANAPKEAFYIPLESYTDAPEFSDLLRRTLDPELVKKRGLISPEWVKRVREGGASDGFLPLKRLFSVVMLELWFERFCPEANWD